MTARNNKNWRVYNPPFTWTHLEKLWHQNPTELLLKASRVLGQAASVLGDQHTDFWARPFRLTNEEVLKAIKEFHQYITPNPSDDALSDFYQELRVRAGSDDTLTERLNRLTLELTVRSLGKPDLILKEVENENYEQTILQYIGAGVDWSELSLVPNLRVNWYDQQVVYTTRQSYSLGIDHMLKATALDALMSRVLSGLAILAVGNTLRHGQLQTKHTLAEATPDVQAFTAKLTDAIKTQDCVGAMAYGAPGTGKTEWAKSFAKEVLLPAGFTVFILDTAALDEFVPPSYLTKLALIINEGDNLAVDRSRSTTGERGKTEKILQLLDSSLQTTLETASNKRLQQVTLITSNEIERLDRALFRQGRIAYKHQFMHAYDQRTGEAEVLTAVTNGHQTLTALPV